MLLALSTAGAQDGGLQDFLELGGHAVPWTREAEAADAGAPCSRIDLLQADSLAADIDVGWEELATMSARRVRPERAHDSGFKGTCLTSEAVELKAGGQMHSTRSVSCCPVLLFTTDARQAGGSVRR